VEDLATPEVTSENCPVKRTEGSSNRSKHVSDLGSKNPDSVRETESETYVSMARVD